MNFRVILDGGLLTITGRVHGTFSSVFLLENKERKILIDPSHIHVIQDIEENLDIPPEEITDIVLTHVHLDHAYNSIFFPNATIRIHENYKDKNYRKFGPLIGQAYQQMIDSWKDRVETFKDGEELFDSIKIIYTPYHSKEHVSLFIKSENMGNLFLPGDICMTKIDFYDIMRNLRTDKVAEIVKEWSKKSDYVIFTHDTPYKIKK